MQAHVVRTTWTTLVHTLQAAQVVDIVVTLQKFRFRVADSPAARATSPSRKARSSHLAIDFPNGLVT